MVDQIHEFKFPKGSLSMCDVLEWTTQLFYGHLLVA